MPAACTIATLPPGLGGRLSGCRLAKLDGWGFAAIQAVCALAKEPSMKLNTLLAAPLLALAAIATPAHAADSLFTWDDLKALHIYHAYSASDGLTYIEETTLPANPIMSGGKPGQLYMLLEPKSVAIARSADGSMIDWHYAGTYRHLLIPLQGDLVFDLGDGKLFHLKPGEAMLAEDWAGRGHRSGCANPTGKTCAVIDVSIDSNPRTIPLRAPPEKR